MQWGLDYRKLHLHAWIECWRVLKLEGIFVLNMKDHIRTIKRKGKKVQERQRVTRWHTRTLERIGFHVEDHVKVPLEGNRQGENHDVRIEYESVIHLVKKVWTP